MSGHEILNAALDRLRDLRDSRGMAKPKSVLEYPLVARKVLDNLTISAPDLGIWVTLPAPTKRSTEAGTVNEMGDEYALKLGRAMIAAWKKVDHHIREKNWVPEASDIRHSVQKEQKSMTLPAFTKLVNMTVGVSEDTVRRDIERGHLKASKTGGGHRRIPASELGRYLAYLSSKTL